MPIRFESGGVLRSFDIYMPADFPRAVLAEGPLPLILCLHGERRGADEFAAAAANSARFAADSGLTAERCEFPPGVVATADATELLEGQVPYGTLYPTSHYAFFVHLEGNPVDWDAPNDARCAWNWFDPANRQDVDYVDADGGVIDRVISLLAGLLADYGNIAYPLLPQGQRDPVDRTRIHLVGFGTGGTMALRLAMEMVRYRPRGVAVVAASVGGKERDLAPSATQWTPAIDAVFPPAMHVDGTPSPFSYPDRVLFLHHFDDLAVQTGANDDGMPNVDEYSDLYTDGVQAEVLLGQYARLTHSDSTSASPSFRSLAYGWQQWKSWATNEAVIPIDDEKLDSLLSNVTTGPSRVRTQVEFDRWSALHRPLSPAFGPPKPAISRQVTALVVGRTADDDIKSAHAFPGSPTAAPGAGEAWAFQGDLLLIDFLTRPAAYHDGVVVDSRPWTWS